MTTQMENTPFIKQLASSDRAERDKALASLRAFLHSGRPFTELELIKLWRGLFFCMWHSDRPKTQQALAHALADLVRPLPRPLLVPFLSAFWTTMAHQYAMIDALRLDKFLMLMRFYVNAAFTYLSGLVWDEDLLAEYLQVVEELLMEEQGKVSDGLRYHVLDLWVDELRKVDEDGTSPLKSIMEPVQQLRVKGRTKTLRDRAKECLMNLEADGHDETSVDARATDDAVDEEWGGIEDET